MTHYEYNVAFTCYDSYTNSDEHGVDDDFDDGFVDRN